MFVVKKGIILWDIDGTLLFNLNESRQSVHSEVFKLMGVKSKKTEHKLTGLTDYESILEFIDSNKINLQNEKLMDKFIELDKCYFQIFSPEDLIPHPGITGDFLNKLSIEWDIGVLTGNTAFRAFLKLGACKLLDHLNPSIFFASKFGDTRVDITQRAERAISRNINMRDRKKFLIGDTPYDVQAGVKGNFRVISVATGDYSYSELNSRNPSMVIRDFQADKDKFLELLNRN
jgi:phosphoglycolate phosphatase-like HAD superfamily hydrolase